MIQTICIQLVRITQFRNIQQKVFLITKEYEICCLGSECNVACDVGLYCNDGLIGFFGPQCTKYATNKTTGKLV